MLFILPAFYGYTYTLCFSAIYVSLCKRPQKPSLALFRFFLKRPRHRPIFGILFVESFGSLVIALFWAFATDTTEAAPAKKGFLSLLPSASWAASSSLWHWGISAPAGAFYRCAFHSLFRPAHLGDHSSRAQLFKGDAETPARRISWKKRTCRGKRTGARLFGRT